MKRVYFIFVVMLAFVLMSNSSCDTATTPTADNELQKKTEIAAADANRQVGMPAIVNFQEKKLLKWIYELCDQEEMICHAYLFNTMTGEVGQYLGQCIGYGIPYSTQFSNPEKMAHPDGMHGKSAVFTKQAEPNQLFKPEGLSATWLIMIDPTTNEPHPVYVEPEIIVSPFKLK